MTLERLWAGWRAEYVGLVGTGPPVTGGTVAGEGAAGPCEAAAGPGKGAAGAGEAEAGAGEAEAGAGEGAAGNGPVEEPPCVFCAIVASKAPDEERLVVWSSETMVAVLNAYPYSSGHLLVMPHRHVRELEDLSAEEASLLWEAVHGAVIAVKAAYRPDGLNLGLNLGRASGAGIPAHLHVHVVPRWIGDTNFMTSVAEVRVLPEALGVSWQRLRAAWAS